MTQPETDDARDTYDVIVVGLGGMGSAAAYHLAARGQRVLGLERHAPAHDKGSSHGGSRITRQSYFEDPAYVPLLLRSYELWEQLARDSGEDVISLTGGVATGRAVMAAAAPRLTPVLLELGGNDAAIMAPDMSVTDELVERLTTATYTTCGQVCMAIKRLYVPVDRVDELAELLETHPELADKDLPLQYYSRERLFSEEARTIWVPPESWPA